MIQNKKLMLLSIWRNNLFGEFSISEIMHLANKKSKPWVFNALELLVKNNLLVVQSKGNINIYRLNTNNPLVFQELQYLEIQEVLEFAHLNFVAECVNKVPVKNYCLIVFGSYAEDKAQKDSDLDICFLVENKFVEKKMRPYVNEAKLNQTSQIDEHYIIFSDFIKMLLREEENLGKQIFKKHKIFFNSDIYYSLVKEAYKSGFRQ